MLNPKYLKIAGNDLADSVAKGGSRQDLITFINITGPEFLY